MLCEIKHKGDVDPSQHVSVLLSPSNYSIIVGNLGHYRLLQAHNASCDDYEFGGYVTPQGMLYPLTGTVTNIPEKLLEVVVSDLSEFFGREIKPVTGWY